jgi:alpha-1,2-mannosyltransferase
VDAAHGARAPVDFARDYVTARARLEDGRGVPPPEGEAGNARAARYGAPEVPLYGAYYHAHPPPTRLLTLPFALAPWRQAAWLWIAASILMLAWLAISLTRIASRGAAPAPSRVALAGILLAFWPPVLHCLEKGQWSIVLAALLAAGLLALGSDRQRRAGVLFGLAAAIKLTPLVLIVPLALRFQRAARAMAATLAIAVAASLAVDGLAPWRAFLAGAGRNAAIWAPWAANTASPAGIYARLFDPPSEFSRPLVAVPGLAPIAFAVTGCGLFVAALLALRSRTIPPSSSSPAPPRHSATALAAWLTLPVLLNPLGWSHVLLMLLAPLAIAARDGSPRTRQLAFLVLALTTIPRLTLARLTGPLPIAPGRGLVLGVHAVAAVILFVALMGARRAEPPTTTPTSHY